MLKLDLDHAASCPHVRTSYYPFFPDKMPNPQGGSLQLSAARVAPPLLILTLLKRHLGIEHIGQIEVDEK